MTVTANASAAQNSAQGTIFRLSHVSGKSSARFPALHQVWLQGMHMRRSLTDCQADRWASKEMGVLYASLRRGPTRPGSNDPVVEIYRSPNFDRAPLKVPYQEVISQSSERANGHPIYLVPSQSPTDDAICAWSGQDTFLENPTTFGGRVEQCLLSYMGIFHSTCVSNGKPRQNPITPETRLTQVILQENCRLQRRTKLCSCTS